MNIVNVNNCQTLLLGRRGENEVTEVIFDFSDWTAEFGPGVIDLYVQRNGDAAAYPVLVTTDGTTATWIVTATDTNVAGVGRAEYVYRIDGKIAKSAVFQTCVMEDIGQPASEPPDPYESWLEQLTALGAETEAHAQAAEQSAEDAAENAEDAAGSATSAEGYAGQAETAAGLAQAAQTASEAAKTAAQAAQSAAEDAAADAQQAAQQAHVEYEQLSGEVYDLSDEVTQQKSAFLNDLGNQFPMLIVKNQYINKTTGAFENYNGWDRTELIPVANYESITVKSSVQSTYNAFYKADKTFLIRFLVSTAGNTVPIPANAAYVALSNSAAGMENLSIQVSIKTDKEINDLQNDVQSVKDDIADIESVIIKSETLHNASFETSYPSALNNNYVWIMPNPIPQRSKASLGIMSNSISYAGALTVVFLRKNENGTYTKLQAVEMTTVAGNDFNSVNIPEGISDNSDIYIGFYSTAHGMAYTSSGDTETTTRFDYSDIDDAQISASGEFTLNFSYRLIIYKPNNKNVVYVSGDGSCDYTSVVEAMESEPEGTTIIIEPGVYEQDMTECLKKRVVLIGTDRNQCIIRDADGRYRHHALYVSCGYFENLTIEEPYIPGTSHEIGVSDLGGYAVHIDTDNDYAVGKTCEFYHCTIKSDFFPAVGLGMRKNATYIFDDCELENGQIVNRGDYSDEGTLGALYFHDSNGEQGNQYIKVKDCVLKSKLAHAMCPYQVNRNPQNNRVYCDFINNVLYSDVGKYTDTVWVRGDPFNPSTGIFSIGIGYGNSISTLNNN